jgi:hypothetical protein
MGIIPGEGPAAEAAGATAQAAAPADAAQNAAAPAPVADSASAEAAGVEAAPASGTSPAPDAIDGAVVPAPAATETEPEPARTEAAAGHPIVEPDNPESEAIADAVLKDLVERMRNAPEGEIPQESPEDEE